MDRSCPQTILVNMQEAIKTTNVESVRYIFKTLSLKSGKAKKITY